MTAATPPQGHQNHTARPRLRLGVAAGLILFHIPAFLAPWAYTGVGLITTIALVVLTNGIGVGIGFHRLLCHRSFRTIPWLRHLFSVLGTLALQRGPLTWCAL